MPKDGRLYMTFPIDFPEHPKVKPLPVQAKWAFVEMNAYSRRQGLDGVIPVSVAKTMWTPKVLAALIASHSERPLVVLDGETYVIRDYDQHQFTTADLADLHEKRSAAGSAGAKARASAKANAKHELEQNEAGSESRSGTDLPRLKGSLSVPQIHADVDVTQIAAEFEKVTGAPCTTTMAFALVVEVLERAQRSGSYVKHQQAYILDSIRKSPDEWLQLFAHSTGTVSGIQTDPACSHGYPVRQCPEPGCAHSTKAVVS